MAPKNPFGIMTFADLRITRQYLDALKDMGISEPTPIQEKAIPAVRAGQDVIGIAQTGTGKTLAYLLPILSQLQEAKGMLPRCVILVPSKELAVQVGEVARRAANNTDFRIVTLYGGVGPRGQMKALERGCDIVVSTPGRFRELYLREGLHVKQIKHLVLDEADRMMDLGFMPQLRKLLEILPTKRQNLLFSATYPPKTELMAEEFLLWPTRVEVSPQSTPVESVTQSGYRANNFGTKLNLLEHLLKGELEGLQAMIFVREKDRAEQIGNFLEEIYPGRVRTLHANKGQNTRIQSLELFKDGKVNYLVATDVASRGIDIPQLELVFNFTVPRDPHDYVHRIGRTGRAGRKGAAITFIDRSEKAAFARIDELLGKTLELKTMPDTVKVAPTPKWERQVQARAIDREMRKADPDFKGAFHEKKRSKPKKAGKKRLNKSKP
jgi:ATP-dependent RNA helicase RhlE